jgi:hypothetical protein
MKKSYQYCEWSLRKENALSLIDPKEGEVVGNYRTLKQAKEAMSLFPNTYVFNEEYEFDVRPCNTNRATSPSPTP